VEIERVRLHSDREYLQEQSGEKAHGESQD
jgi:hypothetical protein